MSQPAGAAIVLSRMPRLIAPDAVWLSGLRAALRRINERSQVLLVASGTSGSDFLRRGAERLGVVTKVVPDASAADTDAPDSSTRDRGLIERADEVLVLGIRPRGNLHRLLAERLEFNRRGVLLVDLPGLQPDPVKQELLSLGAVTWTPPHEYLRPISNVAHEIGPPTVLHQSDSVLPFGAIPPRQTGDYLTHTTRACPGPWPGQPREDYLDSLLDSRPDGDHSALNTLLRIVGQRRLIGSGRTIRGGHPVVSFTGVNVRELPGLRCFQNHRARWDFEPYAVSIRRGALERLGARAASYGGETVWDQMADGDRPYFQLSGDSGRVDWSMEQEWRFPGDLDLSCFGPDEVMLFVPNVAAARRLRPHAPWPITLWPAEV